MSKPNLLSLALSLLSLLMVAIADGPMADIALALVVVTVVTLLASAGNGEAPLDRLSMDQ